MSLKPPKKSDLEKSWLKPRSDRKRKIQPEYHLIITEGTKTEPLYFGAIKKIIDEKYRKRIQLKVEGGGNNTVNLFSKAKEYANENEYRHVWIVYDTDDFPSEDVDRVVELCRDSSTDEKEFHPIWSNQCIELWYLLHFSYMHSDLHRKEYFSKLSDCLASIGKGKYEKNRKDMYYVLRPYMDNAIKNARKLAELNGNRPPSNSAPGTRIYELIERLRPYL